MNRCTGHCCKDFTLPVSPLELKHLSQDAKIFKKGKYLDIEQIAEMVIFKGQYESAAGRRGIKKIPGDKSRQGRYVYHYTCKNFDAKNKICMNYEKRPMMCRDFPGGRTCPYKGCTMRDESEL